jgi:hypothetical protein
MGMSNSSSWPESRPEMFLSQCGSLTHEQQDVHLHGGRYQRLLEQLCGLSVDTDAIASGIAEQSHRVRDTRLQSAVRRATGCGSVGM